MAYSPIGTHLPNKREGNSYTKAVACHAMPCTIRELGSCMGLCDETLSTILNPTYNGYYHIKLKKRDGSTRFVLEPKPSLRVAQKWVLRLLAESEPKSTSRKGETVSAEPAPLPMVSKCTNGISYSCSAQCSATGNMHPSSKTCSVTPDQGKALIRPPTRPVEVPTYECADKTTDSVSTLQYGQYGWCQSKRLLTSSEPQHSSIHNAAHAYMKGRSIRTHAMLHVKQRIVITADLENFFPSILYDRVVREFKHIGCNEVVADALGLIVTARPYHNAPKHLRYLPQGAITSPTLSNLTCRRMDRKLSALARHNGMVYSRYADDIALSSSHDVNVPIVLDALRRICKNEGFRVHKEKIQQAPNPQLITGLIVNTGIAIPQHVLDGFLCSLETADPIRKAGIFGYLNMVDPDRFRAIGTEL